MGVRGLCLIFAAVTALPPGLTALASAWISGSGTDPKAATAPKVSGAREVSAMDTDGDQQISSEEHAAGARTMFLQMDANADGQVVVAEMDAARPKGSPPAPGELTAAEKIAVVDRDGDGRISAREHAVGAAAMFERMDADRDGSLTAEEIQKGHDAMPRKDPATGKP